MPRAGWCRECGEWIWVDEQDACLNGHGPECVSSIHEGEPERGSGAPEAPRVPAALLQGERGFGEGEMPADLARFNWGAFTLPLFWAFAYGAWPIVSWWLISLMLPLLLAAVFEVDGTSATLSRLIAISAASEVVNGLVRLWAGLNGNRLVWMREGRRLSVFKTAKPRFSVERFAKRQRTWATVGWVTLGIAAVATAVINAAAWKEFGLEIAGAVEPFVWLGAEIGLGVWLGAKLRQESSPPAASEGE